MATTGRGTPRVMRLFEASVESPDLRGLIQDLNVQATDQVRAVLEFVRKDVLYFLKSYTNVMRPPAGYQRAYTFDSNYKRIRVSRGDMTGWRPAHPGGWADISQDLMKGYRTDVSFVDGAWRLTIGNVSDHAQYVEARDGFFVVSGVMERNGPVARSIVRAIKALGLPWKVEGVTGADVVFGEASFRVAPSSGVAAPPTEDFGS